MPRRTSTGLWAAFAAMFLLVALPAHTDDSAKQFDIKAQPVSEALMAFGVQSGTIVLASTALTINKMSSPVRERSTPAEALKRILRGTGLRFAVNADGSFVIEREPPPIHQPAASTLKSNLH